MDPELYRELLATLKHNRQLASVGGIVQQQQPHHLLDHGTNTLLNNSNALSGTSTTTIDPNNTSSNLQASSSVMVANKVYDNRTQSFDPHTEEEVKPKLQIRSNNKEYDESVKDYLREEKRLDDAIFLGI